LFLSCRSVVRSVLGCDYASLAYTRSPTYSKLSPYTTLFRSCGVGRPVVDFHVEHGREAAEALRADAERVDLFIKLDAQFLGRRRSEEHTSELQSRENLVCRLLLEKKNLTEQSKSFIHPLSTG